MFLKELLKVFPLCMFHFADQRKQPKTVLHYSCRNNRVGKFQKCARHCYGTREPCISTQGVHRKKRTDVKMCENKSNDKSKVIPKLNGESCFQKLLVRRVFSARRRPGW